MMVNALKQLTDIPTEIITFSDDMDGFRKVPENVPNQELLNQNLHKPLTQVPDPFEKFSSFGEHNNEMLKEFLDNKIKIGSHGRSFLKIAFGNKVCLQMM